MLRLYCTTSCCLYQQVHARANQLEPCSDKHNAKRELEDEPRWCWRARVRNTLEAARQGLGLAGILLLKLDAAHATTYRRLSNSYCTCTYFVASARQQREGSERGKSSASRTSPLPSRSQQPTREAIFPVQDSPQTATSRLLL